MGFANASAAPCRSPDKNRLPHKSHSPGKIPARPASESLLDHPATSPSVWLNGGAGVRVGWAVTDTTLGPMLVAATQKGICRLSFGEEADDLVVRFPNADLVPELASELALEPASDFVSGGIPFAELLKRAADAVEHPQTRADLPLDVHGTAFQHQVWQELQRIPKGETRTYGEVAAAAGHPMAARAVGAACGANSVAVLIPCHRVVRSDGSHGGYAYGTKIKRALLEREQD